MIKLSIKCCEITYKNYGNCVCIDNGKIRLIATTDVGPRIIFFGFCDGSNVLFEDTDRNFYEMNRGYGVWYAYGGHRIWCAPEAMPETYFPDNSKVTVNFKGDTLTLAPPMTTFGKQFSLVISMDDDHSVTVENRITNCSDNPMEFAPWSVTGLAPGGTEFIPLCGDNNGFLPNRTLSLWSYSSINDKRFTLSDKYALLIQDPKNEAAFKTGFNITDGYIVYVNNDIVFKKSFGNYQKVNYPDFSCNFETYTNHLFLECEILGEMKNYAPNETAVITEKWELFECGTGSPIETLIVRTESGKV